jgi:DNA-binding transcriptional regulator of glucitol operon
MVDVRERWLSKRTVPLHVAALVLVPGCAVAAWWQVTRAADGNQLSYLYMVMWPVFGLLAIVFWWILVHTDYEAVGLKGMRRQAALAQEDPAAPATATSPDLAADRAPADDDPDLAAYNARLASLSAKGAKTWRNRESVVVRRAQ